MGKKKSREKPAELKFAGTPKKLKAEKVQEAEKTTRPKKEVFSASGFADRYITSPAKKGMFLYFTKGDSSKRTPREWRKIAEKKGLKL